MGCFDHTSNTINLLAPMKYATLGIMEHCVFMKDIADCCSTTHRVLFAKDVDQITQQQSRYAVGHGLPSL